MHWHPFTSQPGEMIQCVRESAGLEQHHRSGDPATDHIGEGRTTDLFLEFAVAPIYCHSSTGEKGEGRRAMTGLSKHALTEAVFRIARILIINEVALECVIVDPRRNGGMLSRMTRIEMTYAYNEVSRRNGCTRFA